MRIETNYFVVPNCPDDAGSLMSDLLDRVDKLHGHLEGVFGLNVRWPHPHSSPPQKFTITLNSRGDHAYGEIGKITLDEQTLRKRSTDPNYFNRGPFHESVHGILEGFGHQNKNCFPEALAAIVQVEALKSYQGAGSHAVAVSIAAENWGWDYGDVPEDVVHALWLAYDRHGFDDFRKIIEFAGNKVGCLSVATWKSDWNQINSSLKLQISI